MLMIASSSDNSPFPGKKEAIHQIQTYEKKNPSALSGVKYDLKMFKSKFAKCNLDHIETSNECGTLLPWTFITNWLGNKFKHATKDVYLFYTGHGHLNGDWAIETM